jgi:hypothetical protein
MYKESILSIAVAIIIFVINQKKVYDFTSQLSFMQDNVDELGCPTQKGILIHSILGGIIFLGVAYFVKTYIK